MLEVVLLFLAQIKIEKLWDTTTRQQRNTTTKAMLLVECEQGMEVGGERTTEELYADGYKDVCEVEWPSDSA